MIFSKNPLRKRQHTGALIGIGFGILLYILLPLKKAESFLSLGPMNTGHEGLSCNSCHSDAPGNMYQQLVSNTRYVVGMRSKPVDFGTLNVDNKKCLECHERPKDRHPTHRFLEPRFKEAIKVIDATHCETCHREHNGVRVVLSNASYCVNCHSDLTVEKDPLDVSHEELIAQKQWNTCIQCHDFHGNHQYKVAVSLKDTLPLSQVNEYLKGGKDPYSEVKKVYPLSEAEWKKTRRFN